MLYGRKQPLQEGEEAHCVTEWGRGSRTQVLSISEVGKSSALTRRPEPVHMLVAQGLRTPPVVRGPPLSTPCPHIQEAPPAGLAQAYAPHLSD